MANYQIKNCGDSPLMGCTVEVIAPRDKIQLEKYGEVFYEVFYTDSRLRFQI